MIGGMIVSNARLMKPLFYDGNFNRDGKKMRAVFEREISDGTVSYRLVTGSQTSSIPAQRMITISFMRRSGTIWFLCESRISI